MDLPLPSHGMHLSSINFRIIMPNPERVGAEEAHEELSVGNAILACAYADDEKCERLRLEGAISLNALRDRLPSLSKDQKIVFYCA